MADQHYEIPLHVEQDQVDLGDELPTYNDLAEQTGPNSRFGRWREWIEKRAAERYRDLTPEERARRRERGWELDPPQEPSSSTPIITVTEQSPGYSRTPPLTPLYIQTDVPTQHQDPQTYTDSTDDSAPLAPLPLATQILAPTHLLLNQFGSRFLPHATSPIRCLLPLLSDQLLLIGHEEGLSVLNMFPQEWTESGQISFKSPEEAQARCIWEGEGVYQMTLLEEENIGQGSPQGVVLALVGPSSYPYVIKDTEAMRTVRMYNLASLTSLAKWAVAQNVAKPLDLRHNSNWNPQSPTKKHRKQASITRSLKSLIIEAPSTHYASLSDSQPVSSYPHLLSPSTASTAHANSGYSHTQTGTGGTASRSPVKQDSLDAWDVIEDLPLRWATDYVPLAASGSRLCNISVLFYDLWHEDGPRTRGGATLAVATKSNIFLYQTPKGERAFKFVKEFYTPMQPRSITFIQQSVQDIIPSLTSSNTSPPRFHHTRDHTISSPIRHSVPTPLYTHTHTHSSSSVTVMASSDSPLTYGTQRSLFVIFKDDKRAGWIRIADSAAGEINLYEDGWGGGGPGSILGSGGGTWRDSHSVAAGSRLSRGSFESSGHQTKGHWIPPVRIDLPAWPHQNGHSPSRSVYLLTHRKQTHILPCPLPTNFSSRPPIHIVSWEYKPTMVHPRLCYATSRSDRHGESAQPFLQLIGFCEEVVEVQEMSLAFLNKGKGKGSASVNDVVRAEGDIGGDIGYLCHGGRWDRFDHLHGPNSLYRSDSDASNASGMSTETLASEDTYATRRLEEGVYGWCRKGNNDWRVFWLGGATKMN